MNAYEREIDALHQHIRRLEERIPPYISKVIVRRADYDEQLEIVSCGHDGSGFVITVRGNERE